MNTIYTRVSGGLGNQLWQMAAGAGIAEGNGRLWACDPEGVSVEHQWGIFRRIHFEERDLLAKRVKPPGDGYAPVVLPEGPVSLKGFWQSWRYFESAQAVREMFVLGQEGRELIEACGLGGKPVCGVHFRGTDYYKTPGFHDVCGADYYARSLEGLRETHTVVLFTDDEERARSIGMPVDVIFRGSDWESFQAMAACEALVMANSSFSWWAAFLGEVPVVTAPGRWYGPKGPRIDIADLVWPSWKIIEPGNPSLS